MDFVQTVIRLNPSQVKALSLNEMQQNIGDENKGLQKKMLKASFKKFMTFAWIVKETFLHLATTSWQLTQYEDITKVSGQPHIPTTLP